jgi:hypothetical protein
VAAAVKLLCKKPFAGPERVGRIYDDKVVFVFEAANKFQAVLKENVHAFVGQRACREGQMLAADLNDLFVNFDKVDA